MVEIVLVCGLMKVLIFKGFISVISVGLLISEIVSFVFVCLVWMVVRILVLLLLVIVSIVLVCGMVVFFRSFVDSLLLFSMMVWFSVLVVFLVWFWLCLIRCILIWFGCVFSV